MSDGTISGLGNGSKVLVTLVTIFAVITGVAAIIRPTTQRMDFFEKEMAEMRTLMNYDNEREVDDQAKFARLHEMFIEVETQFDGVNDKVEVLEEQQRWWARNMPILDAEQTVRLDYLEKELDEVYKATHNGNCIGGDE